MKGFLILLILLPYIDGSLVELKNNYNELEDNLIKFNIEIFDNNTKCLENTNSITNFDFISNCNCFRDNNDCKYEIFERSNFQNFNWSFILNDFNISYFNISSCITNQTEDECIFCDKYVLNYKSYYNSNICSSIYAVTVLIILLIICICLIGVYFVIKNNRNSSYTRISESVDNSSKRYRFFKK